MYTLDDVLNNGHKPTLAELRGTASRLGIDGTQEMERSEIMKLLGEAERKIRDDLQDLRKQCVQRGLNHEGTLDELELRLAAADANTVSKLHRRAYWTAVGLGLILGIAGLAVSLPTISVELATQMNTDIIFGICLAVIIDFGFIVFKVIDNLSERFQFSLTQRLTVWVLMITCLGMSATLNASKFMRAENADPYIQIPLAIFISLFVFCMFAVCAKMIVRCEPKRQEDIEDMTVAKALVALARKREKEDKVIDRLRAASS